MRVALLPANPKNRPVRKRYEATIESKVRFDEHADLIPADTFGRLMEIFPDGASRMWAVTPGKRSVNIGKWKKLRAGDPVTFYGNKQLYAASHIALLFQNSDLAERLWGRDEDGQTWEYMFALAEHRTISVPIEEVREVLGWSATASVMGITVVRGLEAIDLADLINLEPSTALADDSSPAETKSRRSSAAPDGPTDGTRVANWRREHSALKRRLVELAADRCALCGRSLPAEFLVGAHIKKRWRCSDEERKDFDNIGMLACVLGCDSLFERGYIGVGSGGELLISNAVTASTEVEKHVTDHLRGRTTHWWKESREPYFAWHRDHVFQDLADDIHT
ncbi:hypothetical protein [Nocardia lijiangensis]|uniref:hypothetical protein n=1 Tax=Nocardia lijiangensis TaxID=299618 RepID=UPI00082F6CE6|nr:hypothetical protein [Nocardia lijiangensis]